MKAYLNGTLVTGGTAIPNGVLVCDEATVVAAGPRAAVPVPPGIETIDVDGAYICPGFIDVHVHGGGGADFADGTTEAIRTVARYHASGGTTALLATTLASPRDEYVRVLSLVGQVMRDGSGGAAVLGVHLEGPYFAYDMRGCHLADQIRNPNLEECGALLSTDTPVRWMTLAPELPGALELIRLLRDFGVVVAAGHSEAREAAVDAALAVGLSHATHLYCAMSTFVKEGPRRIAGLAETALARDAMTMELVCDGIHVPPTMMRYAWRAKGTDRTLLVTDAMRGAGMPDGTYRVGGPDGALAIIEDSVARMPDNTGYASSTAQMSDLVRVAVEQVGVPLPDAIRMVTANPAAALGLTGRKGTLAPGADADLVILGGDITVNRTVVAGETVYAV